MGKRTFRTAVLLSLSVLLLVFVTVSLTMASVYGLFCLGVLNENNYRLAPLVLVAISMVIGTVMAMTFGRHPVRIVEQASALMSRVAKGDFTAQMPVQGRAEEFHEIARSFNVMVQELAGTEMLRNDFVENVSHEFKTPLTAIEGYTTLLQKPDLSEEKRLEYTRRILVSTQRLNALTGNILLLSRLENQQMQVKRERYCLDEQLRECILLLEDEWSAREIDLDIDLTDCEITANRDLLAQVWQNVIGNAVKFTPRSGKISVALRQTDTGPEVTVADNGCGMTGEQQRHMFEKFYQGDRSRSTQGNGLGLALAKRIVDLHGGTIQVQSAPDQGTKMTISIPNNNATVD